MNTKSSDKWFLTFVTEELSEGDGVPRRTIRTIEPICKEIFNKDKKAINEYSRSLKLVKSVQLNINDFLKAIVDYAADFLETGNMNDEMLDHISLDFSRLFLNVLSMFKSFLDHSKASISREFGKDSEQYVVWEEIQSQQYDSVFEYRFFSKLRDYCQHIGMPPWHISYSRSIEQEGIIFELKMSRDELLKERRVWKKVLCELELCPEHLPIVDSLNNWSESFIVISKTLLKIKRDAAIESAQRILEHRIRLNLPEDSGQLYVARLSKTEEDPESVNVKLESLPEEMARELIIGTTCDTEQ